MKVTNYRKLVGQLQALAPMCNFEMPEVLCEDKELYFRDLYNQANKEISSLVNLARGAAKAQGF